MHFSPKRRTLLLRVTTRTNVSIEGKYSQLPMRKIRQLCGKLTSEKGGTNLLIFHLRKSHVSKAKAVDWCLFWNGGIGLDIVDVGIFK